MKNIFLFIIFIFFTYNSPAQDVKRFSTTEMHIFEADSNGNLKSEAKHFKNINYFVIKPPLIKHFPKYDTEILYEIISDSIEIYDSKVKLTAIEKPTNQWSQIILYNDGKVVMGVGNYLVIYHNMDSDEFNQFIKNGL